MVLQVGSTVQTMIGYHCAHLVKPVSSKHHATKQDVIFLSSVSSVKLDVPYSWLSVVVLQVGSTMQTMIGYHFAHLVRPVSTKQHATKQDVIFLSSVSSLKLDVPYSWPNVVVHQVGSTVQTMIGYHFAHLVKPVTSKHLATKQNVIFLSSVSSIKFDVPYSWPSVVVLQVGSTVQTLIGYHFAHLVRPVSTKHHATKQDVIFLSSVLSVKLDVPYSWLSVVVLKVGSTVQIMIGYHFAHLVRPVSTKQHATKQDVIFLSSVSSVKLDVPYSWLSVVVLQVGSTVQTMIGYHCVHLVKPVSSKHHATKQDVICLSSVSSVKLDVPCSWPIVVVFQVGSTVQTLIGYHFEHLVRPVSTKHHATKQDVIFLSSVLSVKLDVPCSWMSLIVVQVGSTMQTMIGYHFAHLVRPVSTKQHATKQDVIFLSSVSSLKLDVPYSWPNVVVHQVGSTVQTMIGYHFAHLVKPVTSKHLATKQNVIFLSSVSSIKFDVPYSWPSVVVLQVGSTVQTLIGYHFAHLVRPVSTKHHATKQDVIFLSSVLSVKLDVPYSWLSVVVLKVGSTVQIMIGYHFAHLVRPVSTKQHATKQDVIFLSSVSSVKLDVPYSWLSVVVLQVGSTVQTMIGYHCVHLVKPVSSKHHATKQDVICLSSVSSVKLDVPCSWPIVVVFQVGSTVQTLIGYHFEHLVRPVSTKHHATKQDVIFLSSVLSVKLDVPYSWLSVVVLQVGSTVQTMIGYHFAHLVRPVSTKQHATKQDVIFLSSVSSVKLDVPYSWLSVVVLQVGSTVQTMIGYHCVHLLKPVSSTHRATKQDVIFLSSVSSVKLDVPCSWMSLIVVLQVGSTAQTMFGFHCAHLVKPATLKHHATKQDVIFLSSVSSVKLDVPFLDQVWWFFKLVAQCKLWLATSVAHLVKPATLKHHATKQQIICLSSVSSVKLDVPFSWPSVVVLQVGSTVQTMIGYHCGTSCEASDFETSCNKATNHLFIKRFKRQAWCTFFLTKCGGSSSW